MANDANIDPGGATVGNADRRSDLERRHQPEQFVGNDRREHIDRRHDWEPTTHVAEEQVKAFLTILKDEYGLRPEDLRSFRHDLQWMRMHHKQMEKWAGHVGYGALMTLAGGIMFALWEGIKHFAGKH
jgi:hypothetical protein